MFGKSFIVRGGKLFFRIGDINKMMGDASHFLSGNLAGANIETLIHLPRVGGNDLPVKFLRQSYTKI